MVILMETKKRQWATQLCTSTGRSGGFCAAARVRDSEVLQQALDAVDTVQRDLDFVQRLWRWDKPENDGFV